MTWTGWLAFVAAQLVAVGFVLFLRLHDLPRAVLRVEKLICLVLGLGLLAMDAAVLFGYVGPGWPVPARYSIAVLAVAVAVWLLNDIVYLAVKGADVSYPRVYPGYDARARNRQLILLRLVGVVVAAVVMYWALSPR
jgi:hypothetical protein